MDHQTVEVAWARLRPGVTVLRSDGRHGQAALVDCTAGTVAVLYSDGHREHHEPTESARVLVCEP
jgi:hypothetical protein